MLVPPPLLLHFVLLLFLLPLLLPLARGVRPGQPLAPLLHLFLTLWVSLLLTSRVLRLFPILLQGNMNMTPTPTPTPTLTNPNPPTT